MTADPDIPGKTLWRAGWAEKIVVLVLAGAAIVAGVVFLGSEVARRISLFEAWIDGLGAWGPAAFVLMYAVLSSLLVPDILLGIVAGTLFGFLEGVAAVVAGSAIGAAVQYALSRSLLKPVIDRFLASRPSLAAVQRAVRRQELRLQVLIRLTPLSRALTTYVLGATGVGFARFAAACVAMLPSLCLEVYVGYAGKFLTLETSQHRSLAAVHDITLLAGLVMAVVAMVVVSRTARRALAAAATTAPPE